MVPVAFLKRITIRCIRWLKYTPLWEKGLYLLLFLLIIFSLLVTYKSIEGGGIYRSYQDSEEALYIYNDDEFQVEFGSKPYPNIHRVRFEATPSDLSFEQEQEDAEESIWTRLLNALRNINISSGENKVGMEFFLVGAQNSQDGETLLGVDTSTRLVSDDGVETIFNEDVISGVDITYQVINGRGIKEDIVVNQSSFPPKDQFIFSLHLDEGLQVKESFTRVPSPLYYIEDEAGRYVAHFEPLSAEDANGKSTTKVNLRITGNLMIITVDYDWLTQEGREYPIRIDPTIVHDASSDFLGTFNRTQVVLAESDTAQELESDNLIEHSSTFTQVPVDENTTALWRMNNDWFDISGNSHHGTANQQASFSTTAKLGSHSGTFDGSGDWVDFGAFSYGNTFTVEGWIKPTDITGTEMILSKKIDGSQNSVQFYMSSANIHARVFSSSSVHIGRIATSAVTPLEWQHIAFTYDGGSTASAIKIYKNGAQVDTTNDTAGTFTTFNDLNIATTIGAQNTGTGGDAFFNGLIDDMRISSVVRTLDEIKLTAGVDYVALYHMNNDWLDASGQGFHGTPTSGAFTTSAQIGSHAGTFADNGYVTLPNTLRASLSTEYTVSAWVYPTNVAGGNSMIATYKSTTSSLPLLYQLDQNNTDVRFIVRSDAGVIAQAVVSGAFPTANKWYHVAGVRNGSNLEMYVNGGNKATASNTFGSITVNKPLIAAAVSGSPTVISGNRFEGRIDELRIIGRALTEDEIRLEAQTNTKALFHFNSDWTDSSINEHVGTPVNGATFSTTARLGSYAASFDGSNDHVTIPNHPALQLKNFTLEAWVNPAVISGDNRTIIHKGNSDTNDTWNYILRINSDGTLHIEAGSGTGAGNQQTLDGTSPIPTGKWTHIAATIDDTNNEFNLYINGTLEANGPMTITPNSSITSNLYIGQRKLSFSLDDPFNGKIDELMISGGIRTPEEIEESAAQEPNVQLQNTGLTSDPSSELLAHFENDWTDSSPHGRDGTPGDGATFSTDSIVGSYSATFDGSGDYTDFGSFNYGEKFSIETWIKPTVTSGTQLIVNKKSSGGGTQTRVQFYLSNRSLVARVYSSQTDFIGRLATNKILPGKWQHVAFTYDGGAATNSVRIYIDGEQVDDTDNASGTFTTFDDLLLPTVIAAQYTSTTPTSFFNGSIDELKIYSSVLSPEEIKAASSLYTYGNYLSEVIDLGESVEAINSIGWTEKFVTEAFPSSEGVLKRGEPLPATSPPLIAAWYFNEISGTTLSNQAGTGSCGGTPTNCDGILTNFADTSGQDVTPGSGWTAFSKNGRGSLVFDGVSDNVSMGTTSPLINFGEGDFAIEAWFKSTAQSTNRQTILSYTPDVTQTVPNYDLSLRELSDLEQNFLTFSLFSPPSNSGIVYSLMPIAGDNVWHHVVIQREEDPLGFQPLSMYIDGQFMNSITHSTTNLSSSANSSFKLGYMGPFLQGASNKYFKGEIDTVRFYNGALSVSEIKALASAGYTNLQLQTRTGSDTTPNDGTWEEWRPAGTETQLEDFEGILYEPDTANLVSYWPMDEDTNNTCSGGSNDVCDAADTNDGLISTSVPILDGVFGNSRVFDGSNYIDVAHSPVFDFDNTESFSISTWVHAQTDDSGMLINRRNTGSNPEFYFVELRNNGRINGAIQQNATVSQATDDGATIDDNKWHHVTVVFNRDTQQIIRYVDGTQTGTINSINSSINPSSTAKLVIGARNYDVTHYDAFFTGALDEVQIYNKALSATEVKNLALQGHAAVQLKQRQGVVNTEGSFSKRIEIGKQQTDPSVLAHFSLDNTHIDLEGPDDAFDETGNFHGEFNGSNIGSAVVNGKVGKARDFNGTDDYIELTTEGSGFSTNTFTIEAWVRNDSVSGTRMILDNRDANDDGSLLYALDDQYICSYNAFDVLTAAGSITTGDLDHVVCTSDGSTLNIYINSFRAAQTSLTGSISESTNARIGSRSFDPALHFWSGIIDELRIYNRAISQEEVLDSYMLNRTDYIDTTIDATDLSDSSLLSYWIASSRPGTFSQSLIGESAYVNNIPDENTVGLWHLEEPNEFVYSDESTASTNWLRDSSGNGNHGRLGDGQDDAVETIPTYSGGQIGYARKFENNKDIIIVEDSDELDGMTELTLSTWVYLDASADFQRVVAKSHYDGAYSGSYFTMISSFTRPYFNLNVDSTWYGILSSTSLELDQWYHLVFRWKSGEPSQIYINGVLDTEYASNISGTVNSSSNVLTIGSTCDTADCVSAILQNRFTGTIDEVRVDNIARSAEEIKQAYEYGERSHNITVDFGASLDGANLIANQGDTSFTIDATTYGHAQKGSFLFEGDRVIVREFTGGIEYISQGIVDSVNESTGAVTVSAWEVGSTVPTGGFTANADVFKWQEEWVDLQGNWTTRDAVTNLSYIITNQQEGRDIWIDDLSYTSGFLTDPAATSNITSTLSRYIQYRVVETTPTGHLSPLLTNVTIDYDEAEEITNTLSPIFTVLPFEDPASYSDIPTDQGSNVTFKATAADTDGDQYYLAVCRSDQITANNEAPPSCDGGELCVSTTTDTGVESTCSYTADESDAEAENWYAFVCDHVYGSLCSGQQVGSGNSGSPFSVNHDPSFAAVTDNGGTGIDSAADPGGDMIFTATASDADTDGSNDTVVMAVCADMGATASGCTGTTLCNSIATLVSSNPSCTYSIPSTHPGGLHNYYAYVFDNHDLAADANPIMGQYEISNDDPIVSNIIINNGSDISLTENITTDITFTATVTDANSCEDIDSVTGYLYRSGVTQSGCDSGGEADDNYCYADITCTVVTSGNTCDDDTDSSAEYECTASVQYHADPTDEVTEYPGENWLASVTAVDTAAANDTFQSSAGVELLSLTAIDITESIAYGGVSSGSDTGSTNQIVTIFSTGNTGIDVEISGTDMTFDTSIIAVDNQEYALNAFTYGNGTDLSETETEVEINIIKTLISGSPSNANTFWGLFVPERLPAGVYIGTNTITGLKSEVGDW